MMGDTTALRSALVGCGNMGKNLVRILDGLPGYELVAGCDLAEPQVRAFAEEFTNARGYTDYARMLSEEEPDVVVVATNNVTHAMLTIQAAEAGARGVYCEKPMAICMADGRAMVEACRRHGVALAVNHQRRMMPVFATMRRLIEEGAIGQVELIRGGCAGDVLSDGTHTIDTIRHLAGDAEVKWVFGQIYRELPDPGEPRAQGYHVSGGWRHGHPVEGAAMAVFEFETGLRAEIFTGRMQPRGRRYQDYEVFGTEGRLHRAGDQADPPLLIQRNDESVGWQPVPVDGTEPKATIAASLEQFARMVWEGARVAAVRVFSITSTCAMPPRTRCRSPLAWGRSISTGCLARCKTVDTRVISLSSTWSPTSLTCWTARCDCGTQLSIDFPDPKS